MQNYGKIQLQWDIFIDAVARFRKKLENDNTVVDLGYCKNEFTNIKNRLNELILLTYPNQYLKFKENIFKAFTVYDTFMGHFCKLYINNAFKIDCQSIMSNVVLKVFNIKTSVKKKFEHLPSMLFNNFCKGIF